MRRTIFVLASTAVFLIANVGLAGANSSGPMCNGYPATIIGTVGDDFIEGTDGDDVIVTGSGNDTILALAGDDMVCAGNGDDFVVGMQGSDQLWGGTGDDIVIGGPGNDAVYGENGDDILFGNFGNDTLFGGRGDDFLNGDLPFPADQSPAPPGAYEDPNDNRDSCRGQTGTDSATFCERESSIELHPDPADVIFEDA